MAISRRFVIQSTIALLAVGLGTLLAIVGTTIWLGERAQTYFNEVIAARDTRSAAVEMRSSIQTAESAQRGFLVSGNEIYLGPYDGAKGSALQQVAALQGGLVAYTGGEVMLSRLRAILAEKFDEMDRAISLKRERRDAETLALFRSNRGKALTDEANVFLSGIIGAADNRLTEGVSEQRENATLLRWVSIGGGLLIVFVMGGVVLANFLYAREVLRARDEVRVLNATLEDRVKRRTADLAAARDRAEVLVAEVNHRTANSLALVAALVKLQSNTMKDPAAKSALDETEARIYAVASVHKRLYSSGDVRFVALDEYLSGLLEQLEASMQEEGLGSSLRYDLDPVRLATDASINLGVVVTEWVTNAFKYAYPNSRGEVRVRLKGLAGNRAELTVEDDGVGRSEQTVVQGTGLGSRIVKAMATTMGGAIEYSRRHPGTAAIMTFQASTE